MKASEIIKQYKNGRRDFQGLNLRGANFAGQNLSGADFSHCDIRGTNFKSANLIYTGFIGVQAGLQKRWLIIHFLYVLLLMFVSGSFVGLIGYLISLILNPNFEHQIASWYSLIFLIFFSAIIYLKSLGIGIISGVFIFILMLAISVFRINFFPFPTALFQTEWLGSSIIFIITALGTLSIGLSIARAIDMIGNLSIILLLITFLSGVSFSAISSAPSLPVVVIVALILFMLGYFVSKRSFISETIDSWLRKFAIDFVFFGETSFYGASLTDADFTGATLKNTNFNEAILTRICFKNTVKLNLARVGQTILANSTVRDLLITGDGYKKNYQGSDLRGANLDGANLNQANLKQCDLSEASLRTTNLEWANLTEVSALQTNFTRCNLTGACLEAWNIDKTTILDNVDCQYVFLLEKPDKNGNRERHPHDPDKVFQAGDFEQLYSKIMNTVQLLLRNGFNREAFQIAFQEIMAENHEITYDSIQGIEKKGKDVVVTVEIPKDTYKGNIEHQFNEAYEMRLLEETKARYKAILKAKENEITIYRQQNINMTEILINMTNRPINIENNTINIGQEIIKDKIFNDEYIRKFLEQAGAIIKGNSLIEVTDITGKLSSYTPFYVMFIESPKDSDIIYLKEISENLENNQSQTIAILSYENLEDTLCKMEIARLKLRYNFIVIPIPLASIKEALIKSTSIGLLDEYVERYLRGADLFKDRNAIGDTLCFYGRHHFLNALEEDLSRCQGIALLGIRKSGKTSILLQLKLSMQKHPIIYIDLQPYGGYCYGVKLFNEILKQIQDLLNKPSSDNNYVVELFDVNSPAKEVTYQFIEEFCRLAQMLEKNNYNIPIVCLLDEIERIFPTEKDPIEKVEEFNAFFGALRQLSQTKKKLSLLVADVHPDFNRVNIWTQQNVPTNPVFQFFKEIHIQPFALQETKTMLSEIGKFMGVEFEAEILNRIHQESGGHPFIARQIASMIHYKAEKQDKQEKKLLKLITNSSSDPYLKRILKYSDSLKNYFQQNIWDDLNKRNFTTAMTILRLLACNYTLNEPIIEEALLTRLNGKLRTSQFCILAFLRGAESLAICLLEGMILQKWDAPEQYCRRDCESALLWLENAGLIKHHQTEQEISYSLQIELMSSWLKRQMTTDERKKWFIPSETLN
ncbi:MAG: pentapeptide repeat-containing protein [Crocosphaera sp.]